jgi:hypothetical protein
MSSVDLYNPLIKKLIVSLANLQYLSADELLTICEQRLQDQIAKSSDQVRNFYGLNDVRVNCLADLTKLPVRTSHDIWQSQLDNPPFGIYNGYPFDQIRSSKGTTTFQKFWPFTNHAWAMFMIGKIRLLDPLHMNSQDLLMSLDSGSTPLGIPTTVDACLICYSVKLLPAGVLPIQRKVDLVLSHSVTAIVGLPDTIVSIGKLIQERNAVNPIKKIISVGKSIDKYRDQMIELYPLAKIQNDIGSSELSAFAFVCEHGRTHFNIDLTYITVAESGVFNSTGLISANPIFNYCTGDAVKNFRYESCGCGSCLPIINGFVER